MLAYYPESVRDGVGHFVKAYQAIATTTRVPRLLARNEFVIVQEDVGDATLFDLIPENRPRGLELYRDAIDLLVTFQGSPPSAHEVNPPFDVAKFQEELEMTAEFYVERLVGEHDRGKVQRLRELFEQLAVRLTYHPYVLCHRDYHGQNLHVFNDQLYMIDYQDMRSGPDTYDLASLLRDRGICEQLGEENEQMLVDYYRQQAGGDIQLQTRYLESLLQRSIKIIGTFAKQAIVRARKHYLGYIPPTLESVRFCLDRLPEFEEIATLLPMTYKPYSHSWQDPQTRKT